jgi:protein-S-isoprenylcysteine O-methyltransferase Ste14
MGWVVPALFAAGAVVTGIHAEAHIADAVARGGTRTWLDAAYAVLRTAVIAAFAACTIGRAAPRTLSRAPLALVACVVAMGAVTIFGDPPAQAPDALVLTGDVVAVAFACWLALAVAFLGRCFGVLPAARGLVTRGPYSVVRHPVYLGEIGACVGLAIAAPTPRNAVLLLALLSGQALRIRLEERALRDAFPEYERYAQRVPRLLPSLRRLTAPHFARHHAPIMLRPGRAPRHTAPRPRGSQHRACDRC